MRRLLIGSYEVYQVRPSFIMPYQIGRTDEVEKGLYMYHSGASFEAVVHNQGNNVMYWYRAFRSLGRNSLLGTTVKSPEKIPKHLLADEKHTRKCKEKIYLATTVGKGCILGASLSKQASEGDLALAYGDFANEAWELDPNYQPISVNTDGWKATQNAWLFLYDKVTLVLCFLHAALKIRDRSRRLKEERKELMTKVWDCYHAISLSSFSQKIRRLREWAKEAILPENIKEKVFDLCNNSDGFKASYNHPNSHRTSNMLDRLMDYQDRCLYSMRYLHGDKRSDSSRLFVRAISLMWNFHPYGKRVGRHSPFADLNGFVYHPNWLENMNIAASMGGRR